MEKESIILIVDDEPDNFDVIDALLSQESYQLAYVSDADQALNLLETSLPDVILLDVMMPGTSGIDFCKLFKANPQWAHIPVIMVTALSTKEDLVQCLEAGADDFISKPVNGMELRARIRSMLRIKKQYDRVQGLLQLREDMVNMMVHDLRNPLAGIIFSVGMLKRTKLSPEKQQQKIEQIELSGRKLQSMIDSLLMMAKLEANKMVLNYQPTDLYEICTSAITDFQPIAQQSNLEIISDLPISSGSVSVDAAIFRRVVDNLLSNAIKFSPGNSQIFVKATYLKNSGAKVQVIDSGPGVNQATKEIIFQRYEIGNFQEGVNQIGLGLAFCKIAIEAHGGSITLEDNQPKGAIFTINIP